MRYFVVKAEICDHNYLACLNCFWKPSKTNYKRTGIIVITGSQL